MLGDYKSISRKDIDLIKKEYSREAINYLYESGNESTEEQGKNKLQKWKDSINIYMEGDMYENDSQLVSSVIKQIDALKLPFTIKLTKDSAISNFQIYFGEYDYLNDKIDVVNDNDYRGQCRLSLFEDHFNNCKIGIVNSYLTKLAELTGESNLLDRRGIILHEFFHSLGFAGHRPEYNSILFIPSHDRSLSKIDKETIALLYDPRIPQYYKKNRI